MYELFSWVGGRMNEWVDECAVEREELTHAIVKLLLTTPALSPSEQSGGNGRLPGASGHGKRASRHRRGRKAETYSETCRKTAGISTQGKIDKQMECVLKSIR